MCSSDLLGVWSAGSKKYVASVVKGFFGAFPIEFSLSRADCTSETIRGRVFLVKNLSKISDILNMNPPFPVQNSLLLDDRSSVYEHFNPGRVLGIKPWFGNPQDRELLRMASYLTALQTTHPDELQHKASFQAYEATQHLQTGGPFNLEGHHPRPILLMMVLCLMVPDFIFHLE